MTTPNLAPRVYLDTAHLCNFADGKGGPGLFDECCDVLRSCGGIVIFGPGHMADLHRRADAATRARVFDVLDRLPRLATVFRSPPLSGGDHQRLNAWLAAGEDAKPNPTLPPLSDLVLEECTGRFRDAMVARGYQEAGWTEAALEAEQLSVDASGYTGDEEDQRLSREQRKMLADTFGMATRGEDAAAALVNRSIRPELRAHPAVLAQEARLRERESEFAPYARLLGEMAAKYGGTAERLALELTPENHGIPVWWRSVANGTSRWLAAARALAPGLYLKAMLLRDKNRDRRRRPKLSDHADEFHVSLIPYLDVMALDRENLAIMNRHVGDIRAVRTPILVGNAPVDSLLAAVRSL
jgi:hypothetical protein